MNRSKRLLRRLGVPFVALLSVLGIGVGIAGANIGPIHAPSAFAGAPGVDYQSASYAGAWVFGGASGINYKAQIQCSLTGWATTGWRTNGGSVDSFPMNCSSNQTIVNMGFCISFGFGNDYWLESRGHFYQTSPGTQPAC